MKTIVWRLSHRLSGLMLVLFLILPPTSLLAVTDVNNGLLGFWIGTVYDDYLLNKSSGIIAVEVDVGPGDDTVINYGYIGELYGYDGNDTLINHGHILGIDGEDGNDIIENHGSVGWEIFGAEDDDQILNSGKVHSYIAGEGGDDYIDNSGTVEGSIYGDNGPEYTMGADGDDTIVNSGVVNGSIFCQGGDDQVTIIGSASVGGKVDGGSGTDTLEFQGAGSRSSADYANFEKLLITGPGVTTLSDYWLFSQGTVVLQGTLQVNGRLESQLTNYRTLKGSGTIIGRVINNGILAPGNSIGNLVINGSYVQNPGSVLQVEVSPGGSGDTLQINGPANINGGSVEVQLIRALYPKTSSYRILSASSITGSFTQVASLSPSPVLSASVTNQATDVILNVKRNSYRIFGQTHGQQSTGAALDQLIPIVKGTGSSLENLLISMDFDQSQEQLARTLASISPEHFTTLLGIQSHNVYQFAAKLTSSIGSIRENQFLDSLAMSNHQAKTENPNEQTADWRLWGGVGRDWLTRSKGQSMGYDAETSTGGVGLDRQLFPGARLGAALEIVDTTLDFDDPGYRGEQSGMIAGIYSQLDTDHWYLDLLLSYGYVTNDASRPNPSASSPGLRTTADYTSHIILAQIGGGYDYQVANWLLGPSLHLGYGYQGSDDFTESERGSFGLQVASRSENRVMLDIGLRGITKIVRESFTLLPRIGLSWRHDFLNGEYGIDAAFNDLSSVPLAFEGQPLPPDLVTLEIGAAASCGTNLSFSLDAGLGYGEDFSAVGISLGLKWRF